MSDQPPTNEMPPETKPLAEEKVPDAPVTPPTSNMGSKISGMLKENAKLIIVGLVCVAAGAFLIAYLLYWLINKSLISKSGITITRTKIPVVVTQVTKISSISSPVSANGKRFTLGFWVYVHDMDKYRGSLRHVLHLGDDDIGSASPMVFFGANDNKMYIAFNPLNREADPNITNYTPSIQRPTVSPSLLPSYLATTYGISIDYIPIQRWVHICVVVNEEASGGSMSAYVDGDLVKVVTTGTKNTYGNTFSNPAVIRNLNLNRAGSLIIGGSTSDAIGPGFSGLVSRVRLFNYDLNINDIYYEYRSGPIDNLLAKLGLPAYGVRSPVYKI